MLNLRWMKRRPGLNDRDRGATMVLVTVSMIMLLMFGAFAVDLGAAWSQRRENQGAVDSGGVAGALQTRGLNQAAAIAAADTEIIRITYESIAPDRTVAEWNTDWTNCIDGAKGAEFTLTGSSDCISYTSNLQRIRVKTPGVETQTTFAGVIGIGTLTTDAFVEVIVGLGGGGSVLPFGIPGGVAGNTEICLKSGANPQTVPPCDGPTTGNFGFVGITEYGNETLNSTTTCTGSITTRMARNIARGVDHPLLEAPGAAAAFKTDLAGCNTGNFNFGPYSLTTETGVITGVLDAGFIDGVSGLPGRLTLSTDTVTHAGKTFDDKPLWEYLNTDGETFCATPAVGIGLTVDDHDEMATCLAAMTGSTNYFEDSLADSPRFAWVPLFYGVTLGMGNTTLNIDKFRPVFVQTTLWKCNANSCDAIHDPSEPLVGAISGADQLEAMSALQIPRANLPRVIDEAFFGSGSETSYTITD